MAHVARAHVVVVGGGFAGLGAALTLSRRGHTVTVVERDPTPLPATADEAFAWDRRGAPQVRHSHAFLARLRNLLRDRHPDVLAALLEAGASELRFGDDLAPTVTNYVREPGDDDLVMLACRRTTFEWVLRRTVTAEGRVEIITGAAVSGLVATSTDGPPTITGVTLDNATSVPADIVVVATGRRSTLPDWLAAIGVTDLPEEVEDTGIVYCSRFYRLRPGQARPRRGGVIGGDLGYLKYGVFVGDNATFSVTLAVPTDDAELRGLLTRPEAFERVASLLPATAPWIEVERAEAITTVHRMAGLLNRLRTFVVDGEPIATGVHPVGDALLCTNPLYGRGCATGFWSAALLDEAITAHVGDPRAQALAYHEAVRTEIEPWYRSSVAQDAEARRVAAALLAGEDPEDGDDPRAFMRSVFREGLVPALRRDAIVLRAFVRNLNLLTPPDALIRDAEVGARVLAVWQERDRREPETPLGPKTRAELVAAITA
jgi:2-polyprenyl-6-methoxyphenol hydroxylase-like FAD-dependent oxidoreductase